MSKRQDSSTNPPEPIVESTLSDEELAIQFSETVPSGSKRQGSLPSPNALRPWGPGLPPLPGKWATDVMGSPYECLIEEFGEDEEGPVVATLVRRSFPSGLKGMLQKRRAKFILLYIHGRNDYFYQKEFAEKVVAMGGAFYALDLRKYGRSLRPWQTIGFTDDLQVYDQEIDWSINQIRSEFAELPLVVMGHSTGGLIVSLWASRNPGVLSGLILNSAWLELQSMTAMRPAIQKVVSRLARVRPRATVVAASKDNNYYRTLSEGWAGSGFVIPAELVGNETDPAVTGWKMFEEWKLPFSYPAPAAWMDTVLEGHAQVEKGLRLKCPVISMVSSSMGAEGKWNPGVFSSDIVLNPELIAERSASIADSVTIERFPGKHDLLVSDPAVRGAIYDAIRRWLRFSEIV